MRGWAALLVAVGISASFAFADGKTYDQWVDQDKDGRKETHEFYVAGGLRRLEIDRNGDGKTDKTLSIRNKIKLSREEDHDFDGETDRWFYYAPNGAFLRVEKDTNGDGKADAWNFMEQQGVVLYENDRNFDGKVDKRSLKVWGFNKSLKTWQYVPDWTTDDSNFDGIIDRDHARKALRQKIPDKTGQPIDPNPKKAREKRKADAAPSKAEEILKQRQERENLTENAAAPQ